MQILKCFLYTIIIFIIFYSSFLSATVVLKGELKDDVENAHCIISATINHTEYAKDTDGEIITILHLADVELIKGNKQDIPQTIIYVGGVFNGIKSQIVGMANYEAGKRYLFFLRYDNLTCPIIGLGIRSFPVIKNPEVNEQFVYSHQNELIYGIKDGELSLGPKLTERLDQSSANRSISYSEFITILKNIMKMPDYRDKSIGVRKTLRLK